MYFGFLIGEVDAKVTVVNVLIEAKVVTTGSNNIYVGGLFGLLKSIPIIKNTTSSCIIDTTGKAGGFIGDININSE